MRFFVLLLCFAVSMGLTAQETIIFDFEGDNPGMFRHFGSSLEGSDAPVIDNPNATGINESMRVMEFTRPAGSQVWAGAFANPSLPFPVGVSAGSMICVDVHADHFTKFTIKLENSATDPDNWELTMPNTKVNEWETLCYSLDAASEAGAPESAVGNIYPGMAIFKDLNDAAGEGDSTIYIDNMVYMGELVEASKSMVTFSVDVSTIEVGENGMFLAGGAINGWDGSATPMMDNGDNTWSVTVELDAGEVQYKFVNSGEFEEFTEGEPCTITAGGFTNRVVTVGDEDQVLPTYFFNSCNVSGANEDVETLLFDWETPETSTEYKYFGSSLEGGAAEVIDNPDPTGINTSATVIRYVKAANSETWAGAFADPAPGVPIDLTNGGQVCADVWFSMPGNIGLKLEASPTNDNWVDTAQVMMANTWQTVCVDANALSVDPPNQMAIGHVYNQLVIFPDFGTSFTEDMTYFIDNLKFIAPAAAEMNEVTFEVNMNEYGGDFTTVYLSGEFNNWSADANPMSDEDGDGIWSLTIPLASGSYEYKFQVDMWADDEKFDGSDVCTIVVEGEDGSVFVNRIVEVTEDTSIGAVCWASCYDCGASVNITWNVNMEFQDVSADGVYLAGGPFGHAELPAMTDEDGDGIYTITLNREVGFTADYTFLNGICLPNWDCKEQIAGQDCAVDPFNDRNLPAVFQDTTLTTCFGECSTDGTCTPPPATYMATFSVDMSNETVGADGVFLTGGFAGWSSTAVPMSDDDGDNIYTATTELEEGEVQYKFVNSGTYEEFATEDECLITTEDGQFINRLLVMEAKDTVVQTYFFNSCALSSDVDDLTLDEDLFSVKPTVTYDMVTLTWKNNEARNITIVNASGMLVNRVITEKYENERTINVNDYAPGLYFIKMDTETSFGIEKFIVK